jgi:AbrB family looped-hinge helix DNA binding protein
MMRANTKIVDGGRIILPASIRRAMKLGKGDTVVLELNGAGDELRVRAAHCVVRDLQDMLRPYRTATSAVDALIEERRRESQAEEGD